MSQGLAPAPRPSHMANGHVPPPQIAVGDLQARRRLAATAAAALRGRLARRGINLALSGVDGSGKSSLAAALADALQGAGMAVEVMHRYRWLDNLVTTPCRLVANRLVGRRVVVYDRCYLDNVAKFFPAGPKGLAWTRRAARLWRALTTCFDRVFYLHAPYEEVTRRGREMTRQEFDRLEGSYRLLAAEGWLVPVASD